MKQKFHDLLEQLPGSLEEVNDHLTEEEVVMIDFMDGERVCSLGVKDDKYVMFDMHGCEINTVSHFHLLRNSLFT